MQRLAIVYHSAHGHTEHIATHVAEGARSVGTAEAQLLKADELAQRPDELLAYDGVVLGSSTLTSMFVFAMQHGMVWVGNPFLPGQHEGVPHDQAVNRLGSWSGLMAQAGHAAAADAFAPGDIKTARMFGRHVAETLERLGHARPAGAAA